MERFALELPAQLLVAKGGDPNGKLAAWTTDICAGGAFFNTDQSIPLGTEVSIDLFFSLERFNALETNQARIEIMGKVIRSEANGMAVSFDKRYKVSPVRE